MSNAAEHEETDAHRPRCTATTFNARQRRQLMHRISALGPTAHDEIFRRLKQNGVGHTQNANGMFVNLSFVDDALLGEISKFVDYCSDIERDIAGWDAKMNHCRRGFSAYAHAHGLGGGCSGDEGGEEERHENGEDERSRGGYASSADDACLGRRGGGANDKADAGGADAPDNVQHASAPSRAAATGGRADCLLRLKTILPVDDKTCKRRSLSKFAVARKRFSRKRVPTDKKPSATGASEVDYEHELKPEPYIFPGAEQQRAG